MKINLTKIKVQPSLLEEPKEVDLHEIIADLIWKDCAKEDIKKANFALKLLNESEEIEVTDTEVGYILETTAVMKYWLAKAIEDAVDNARNSEITNNA